MDQYRANDSGFFILQYSWKPPSIVSVHSAPDFVLKGVHDLLPLDLQNISSHAVWFFCFVGIFWTII
jgi:hypothetical protein